MDLMSCQKPRSLETGTQQAAPVAFSENLFAPEIFASEVSFFSVANGNISITPTSFRWDYSALPPRLTKVVVGRVVLPIDGAKNLAVGLYDFMNKQGHAPIVKPAGANQVQ
jgi:hypothetical protein